MLSSTRERRFARHHDPEPRRGWTPALTQGSMPAVSPRGRLLGALLAASFAACGPPTPADDPEPVSRAPDPVAEPQAGPTFPSTPCPRGDACVERCDRGDVPSCLRGAEMFRHGAGAPLNKGKARALAEKACVSKSARGCYILAWESRTLRVTQQPWLDACDAGSPEACRELARQRWKGLHGPPNEAAAQKLFKRARELAEEQCQAGRHTSCFTLAGMLEHGVGGAQDAARAQTVHEASLRALSDGCGDDPVTCHDLTVFSADPKDLKLNQRACAAQVGTACYEAAQQLSDNPEEVEALLQEACELGLGFACSSLKVLLIRAGDETRADAAQARVLDLEKQACKNGNPTECRVLSARYRGGMGLRQDVALGTATMKNARELAINGCRNGQTQYCADAATWAFLGNGGSQDRKLGQELLELLCRVSGDCEKLALHLMTGDGVDPDPVRALKLLDETCARGRTSACAEFAGLLERGADGVTRNPRRAQEVWKNVREAYAKRCDAGEGFVCKKLGKLHQEGKGGPRNYLKARQLQKRACELNPVTCKR